MDLRNELMKTNKVVVLQGSRNKGNYANYVKGGRIFLIWFSN